MKQKYLTIDDVLELLRYGVRDYGTQAKYAETLGVTQGYVNDILKRKREPGPKILSALELERITVYREKR